MLKWTGERCIPELMLDGNDQLHQQHLDTIKIQHLARYNWVPTVADLTGKIVLDAACGSGYGTDLLFKAGAVQVFGIDVDTETIKYCKEKYPKNNGFLLYNLENTFPEAMNYDVIVSFETIEHLQDPGYFLAKVERHCRETFIFSIPLNNSSEFHKQVYTLKDAKELFLSHFAPDKWHIELFQQDLDNILPLDNGGKFLLGIIKKK